MNLFADYVQPLTVWLQTNPHWALFITFIIALTESLAIIGSIVPGSITMTAIGMLAGAGIMRIDLTLIAAVLGAVCGDSLSYSLGYYYSERLIDVWPFKKYPHWINYGKEFFSRHGGKSVLIGRFIGPLRSIIPVIAGIMHMKQWRFLLANFASAIGWAILYVLPGIVIGAAGHELSTESATRLFVIILILLAIIWVISLLIKWAFVNLHSFFSTNLHHVWASLKQHVLTAKFFTLITPNGEKDHVQTANLVLFVFLSFLGFVLINLPLSFIHNTNISVHFFTQSLHALLLESIFIICSQFTSTITLIGVYGVFCLWFICQKKFRPLVYISSVILVSALLSILLARLTQSPRPPGLLVTMPGSSFPDPYLLVGSALYGFIVFYINNQYTELTYSLKTFLLTLLSLSGISTLYLGDYWLSDILSAYFIGIIVCICHCLGYRKKTCSKDDQHKSILGVLFISSPILFTTLSTFLHFKTLVHNHTPYYKQYTLKTSIWWNQHTPILPIYKLNRIGKRISILNVQYAGDIDQLQHDLQLQGWHTHHETFFTKVLMHINHNPQDIKLPLLTQLYENKQPALVMTFKKTNLPMILELTIWQSNYTLQDSTYPLWIGAVHKNRPENGFFTPVSKLNISTLHPLSYLMPALRQYSVRRIKLSPQQLKPTTYSTSPYILLIQKK